MNDLWTTLVAMTGVIVVVCGGWGIADRIAARRRAIVEREFAQISDEQLVTGLAELAAAVDAERRRDQSMPRDVHRRTWR